MRIRQFFFFLLVVSLISCTLVAVSDATTGYKAAVIPVSGMIDKGLSGFIKRSMKEAADARCEYLIFEIDTFGGRVDAAVEIRDLIIDSPVKNTIAYINKRAISAGALIALSCGKMYISEGGTIGAAQPVVIGGTSSCGTTPADEKVVSYLRKEFKTTAEKNGYPTDIAEAFVDVDVEIKGVVEKGKLLTLTSLEAKKVKLVHDIIPTRDELFSKYAIEKKDVKDFSMNWSEVLVRALTHPVVSSLLLSIGFLGIIFEIKTPGLGGAGFLGAACLALFFLGHYLIGLAQWFDVFLFAAGVVLVALEIFVIPGFGLPGIAGIACILTGIFLALVQREIPAVPISPAQYLRASGIIGAALLLTVLTAWAGFKYILPRVPFHSELSLEAKMPRFTGPDATEEVVKIKKELTGKTGVAGTSLRPAGKALINGALYDVVTTGEFIEKGTRIVVKEATPSRIIVEEKEEA